MAPRKKIKLLSVIVPALNEEKTIVRDLKKIESSLKGLRYNYEIILVCDGSEDRTYERAKRLTSSKIRIYQYEENKGKGHAVRYGMARAKGELIAFIDAGLDINPNGISMILEHMEWYGADIIVGSKRHPASEVFYPLSRQLLSFVTQGVMFVLFGLKVKDTQTGLKIFKREVLEKVLPRLLLKRWAFDVEILSVANRLGFKKIYEAPVKISYIFSSHVKVFGPNGVWKTGIDTLAVFYRLVILRYYDDGSKRKWKYDPDLDFRVNVG